MDNLISSGRAFIKIDMMIVLIQTDFFPDPVCPCDQAVGPFFGQIANDHLSPVTGFLK